MENTKTKKALIMSVLSMVLCIAMLIGMTFAWFTDTASTGVNKIQAGKLDVELKMSTDGANWTDAEGKTLNFMRVNSENKLVEDANIFWEPGATFKLPQLKLINNGNLALKYKVVVSGITGDSKLLDAIKFTINSGTATKLSNGDIILDGTFTATGDEQRIDISAHMDEAAGNEYQGLTLNGIVITVYATQLNYEYDSENNTYDEKAEYAKMTGQAFTSGIHTISTGITATAPNAIAVKAIGTDTNVTITDGTFDGGSGGNNICVAAADGAKVTIKGGTFTVGGDADGYGNSVVYSQGGNIVIEGGFFQTDYSYRGYYYVLNQSNGNPGTITVKGGTFVNYDPSKGDDNLGGNFVADGYKVTSETKANGDVWYTVVPE